MKDTATHAWVVTLGILAALWPLAEASAAATGAWSSVSAWITGLTALGWLLCVAILVFGVVQFLMGLTSLREEGLGHGMIKGAAVIVGAVIAFFVIPPLVQAGVALGATVR